MGDSLYESPGKAGINFQPLLRANQGDRIFVENGQVCPVAVIKSGNRR
ncbi:hypothetical protein [Desulfobacula toluolica]|uniref:Uncharacterized protein n=1 Tax=Desulfobacula phenolica TaxID=90732 RepID=A0A1H2DMH0_9BACT|nr:hypothetical protein [Desulfobacula toluolica]SDT83941.1 hypothetical protein SAMN04487931_10167 [Desulfobacula phenolica]